VIHQCQDVAIDLGPDNLYEIEGERVTVRLVSVNYPDAGIEPDCKAGEPSLDLR
jgi:hypothetical protein